MGKQFIQALVNGQSPTAEFKDNEMAAKLQNLGMFLRWAAMSSLPTEYKLACGIKEDSSVSGMPWIPPRRFPEATIMALWWIRVEDMVLTHWVTNVLETCPYPAHLSLHFDGIRLDKSCVREAFPNESNDI